MQLCYFIVFLVSVYRLFRTFNPANRYVILAILCVNLAVKYYHVFFVVINYDTKVELKSTVQLIKRRRFHTNRTDLQSVSLSVVEFGKRCGATCPVVIRADFSPLIVRDICIKGRRDGRR